MSDTPGDTTQALQLVINQISDLAHQYGSQAVNLALTSVRVDAASSLLSGFAGLGVAAISYFAVRWLWKQKNDDIEVGMVILVACAALCGLVGLGFFLFNIFDLWNWIALFEPQIWLAHVAVSKIGG